jgi:transposase
MTRQIKALDYKGKTIHVGIDTHLKSWKVAIALENSIQKVFSQDPRPKLLVNHLHKHYPNGDYLCVYEAGFCGFWIQESLEQPGVACKIVNAADVPTTDKEKRQKTDRRDCRKLARGLRGGELEFIAVPPKQLQYDRSVVRTRYKIQRDVDRAKNRISSHLHFYGIEEPGTGRRSWSKSYVGWLEKVRQERGDMALGLLLSELKRLMELGSEALQQVRALSKAERYAPDVGLLLSVPGIGLLTSMRLLVEIGDIKRFRKLDNLCGMAGLVPNTDSSGEKDRVGEMTKRGRKELRTALIESAWVAIRKDPELALCYNTYRKRMKPTGAIVRIAKKLLNRVRRVLLTKEPYLIATA